MLIKTFLHLAYNPRYMGSRVWEDEGSRLAQAKSLKDPISTSKS
jgi:hypothetical protein